MFPVIAAFGPFTISSLGVSLALAFFFGSFSFWRRAKEEHFEDDDIFDTVFISFFGGLIGSRLFYIFMHFPQFGFSYEKWLAFTYSDQFSWIGFLVGLTYALKIVVNHKKWDFFTVADLGVFGIITAQIFLRIGQFLDGSFVGKQTNLPWGLVFPGIDGVRHPLMLYESIILIAGYIFIKWLDKHYRLFSWYQDNRGEAKAGILWLTYLFIVIVSQFFFDFLNERQTWFLVFSLYQIVLVCFGVAVGFAFWLRAGNKISIPSFRNIISTPNEEVTPIREPLQPVQPHTRTRRFTRSRSSQSPR